MEKVLGFLEGIDWDKIGALLTDFVEKMKIDETFEQIVAFVEELAKVFMPQ